MTTNGRNEEDEIDILEYLSVLHRGKKLIISITAGFFILSIIISLLLPKFYTSTASIYPPQGGGGIGSAIASQLPAGLGGIAAGMLGGSTPADLWLDILRSRTVKDRIIKRFDLHNYYKTKTPEDTRKKLGKMVGISMSTDGEVISVSVQDRSPAQAADIANAYIEILDDLNQKTIMTSGRRMRVFVEERLKEADEELSKIQKNLATFQKENMAIELDAQSQAIIDTMGSIKGEYMAREVELKTLLSYVTAEHPRARILKSQLEEIGNVLKELEEGKPLDGEEGYKKNIFIPTSKIPDLATRYVILLRDAKIQEKLFELLTQQYEMARIQEAKDTPTVEILDEAVVPVKKSKPKRSVIVLMTTFFALLFSVVYVFLKEYVGRLKQGRRI